MDTSENNKLIAEFMGAISVLGVYDLYSTPELNYLFEDVESDDETAKHLYLPQDMRFATSWDWLMPVVEKISEDHTFDFNIPNHFGQVRTETGDVIAQVSDIPNPNASEPPTKENPVYVMEFNTSIDACYNLVVRFINWYNKNKKS